MKIIYISLVVFTGLMTTSCTQGRSETQPETPAENAPASPALTPEALVARGHYLVDIMGCNDCHSPMMMTPQGPARDPERLLSGHPAQVPLPAIDKKDLQNWVLFSHTGTAMAGPWGVSFAANLTADSTGIGLWTEEQFATALRKGKFKGLEGGRDLLPPMPWQNYQQMADEDVKAIFAYLKSTRPVKNVVPSPITP